MVFFTFGVVGVIVAVTLFGPPIVGTEGLRDGTAPKGCEVIVATFCPIAVIGEPPRDPPKRFAPADGLEKLGVVPKPPKLGVVDGVPKGKVVAGGAVAPNVVEPNKLLPVDAGVKEPVPKPKLGVVVGAPAENNEFPAVAGVEPKAEGVAPKSPPPRDGVVVPNKLLVVVEVVGVAPNPPKLVVGALVVLPNKLPPPRAEPVVVDPKRPPPVAGAEAPKLKAGAAVLVAGTVPNPPNAGVVAPNAGVEAGAPNGEVVVVPNGDEIVEAVVPPKGEPNVLPIVVEVVPNPPKVVVGAAVVDG